MGKDEETAEDGKLRRWGDEKVSTVQSAWGIGLKADVGRRKGERRREVGKIRRWGKSKTEGWGGDEGGIGNAASGP